MLLQAESFIGTTIVEGVCVWHISAPCLARFSHVQLTALIITSFILWRALRGTLRVVGFGSGSNPKSTAVYVCDVNFVNLSAFHFTTLRCGTVC